MLIRIRKYGSHVRKAAGGTLAFHIPVTAACNTSDQITFGTPADARRIRGYYGTIELHAFYSVHLLRQAIYIPPLHAHAQSNPHTSIFKTTQTHLSSQCVLIGSARSALLLVGVPTSFRRSSADCVGTAAAAVAVHSH